MLPHIFCLVSRRDDLSLLPALAVRGIDGFQVRDKELGGRALVELTRRVLDVLSPTDARVVVNDRLDVALAAGAHGVHLGADDLPVAEARRIAERVAPELLVGATCRSREAAVDAARDGADYAGFGPVFATDSKTGLPDPLGPRALAAAAGELPLIGIGGVDAGNAADVRAAGAHGVAVIGAIWRHPDPLTAAEDLVSAVV